MYRLQNTPIPIEEDGLLVEFYYFDMSNTGETLTMSSPIASDSEGQELASGMC